MGARDTLAELLVSLAAVAAEARPGAVDAGWYEEWRRQYPRIRALLADPVPQVRREALPLADGVARACSNWPAASYAFAASELHSERSVRGGDAPESAGGWRSRVPALPS
ncbi:hypothetical protein JCM4814A_04250 [Streptomyces phaeofaciens JCM 4814]|uniref:Uncharacterized protein n=1 Tax=Streptomyces phaeofaciens TaxID=68254 RepID=A0A918M1Y1_9ACTN|nr:hypothetical protein [Streptomyces phaeofaciens]GGU01261.1 hypothetical protein GCM10010226_92350 [Streptomyces phaeofaciens]